MPEGTQNTEINITCFIRTHVHMHRHNNVCVRGSIKPERTQFKFSFSYILNIQLSMYLYGKSLISFSECYCCRYNENFTVEDHV